MTVSLPTFEDVRAAAARLVGRIVRTPLLRHRHLDEVTGAAVLVKPEPLQRTGSFKLRGATNALLLMDPEARRGGIVTHSSGNHGQACAAAAHMLGVHATIAMPADAPAIKVEATRRWGAEIVPFDRHGVDRETLAAVLATERGATIIPPFDHPDVIAGQGTAALECSRMRCAGPCAGRLRGLHGRWRTHGGCVLAFEALAPRAEVFAVERKAGTTPSARSKPGGAWRTPLRAAGCATPALETARRADLRDQPRHLAGGVVVTEAEVFRAMRFAFEHLKIVAERAARWHWRPCGRQGRGEGRRHRGGGQRRERRSRGLRAGTRDLSGPLPPSRSALPAGISTNRQGNAMNRRSLLATASVLALPAIARAQSFRPYHHVGQRLRPGGSTDITRRAAGRPDAGFPGTECALVVENRPGASGTVAADWLRRQPADGHVLMLNEASSHVLIPNAMQGGTRYNPMEDFTHVAMVANGPLILVAKPNFSATNAAEAVQRLRAGPQDDMPYASSGVGSIPHFAGVSDRRLAQSRRPFRACALPLGRADGREHRARRDRLGRGGARFGRRAGARHGVRGIALTGLERFPAFPDIPTLAESGIPGFDLGNWFAVVGRRACRHQ